MPHVAACSSGGAQVPAKLESVGNFLSAPDLLAMPPHVDSKFFGSRRFGQGRFELWREGAAFGRGGRLPNLGSLKGERP